MALSTTVPYYSVLLRGSSSQATNYSTAMTRSKNSWHKVFESPATNWGKKCEDVALKMYTEHQHRLGHADLYTCRSGFVISEEYPFLGASPDAVVYDPTSSDQFGLAEVKYPYSCRDITPSQACSEKYVCSILETSYDGKEQLKLKHNHIYFPKCRGR